MTAQEAYRNEMEIEIEVMQVKLTMLKALTMNLMMDGQNENTRNINSLQRKVTKMKEQLQELDRINENAWMLRYRGGIEETWVAMQISLHNVARVFEAKE